MSAESGNNSEVEKFGRKEYVNWNHTELVLNCYKKDSDLILVDTNHTNSDQPIPSNLTNIGSIHDSADIHAIEKILASRVYFLVQTSSIFTYGNESDLPSPLHDLSAEIVTREGNPKTRNNPPNPVLYVPAFPK